MRTRAITVLALAEDPVDSHAGTVMVRMRDACGKPFELRLDAATASDLADRLDPS